MRCRWVKQGCRSSLWSRTAVAVGGEHVELEPPACPPGRVDQQAAIGMATERSAATRLKDSLSLSRVDQQAAIRMATERSVTTQLKDSLFEPGGSASRYRNGYGTQCGHPARGRTDNAAGGVVVVGQDVRNQAVQDLLLHSRRRSGLDGQAWNQRTRGDQGRHVVG